MKKTILSLGVVATFVLLIVYSTSSGCSSDQPNTDTLKTDSSAHTTGITSDWSNYPMDMDSLSQLDADTFSWRSFIAACWPAITNGCGPDTSKSILSGKGPLVWETYLSSDQVFPAKGVSPVAWCSNGQNANALQHVPSKVLELSQKTGVRRFIHLTSKSDNPHALDQASGGPLVDQNGRFARYEKRVNETEYNYIVNDTLWSISGQQAYVKNNDFFFPNGSMEFKAAWKIMGAGDDTSRFYTIRAIVYNDATGEPSPGPNPVTLGLVGLHIAHKTPGQKNWAWSTFEHVDNLTKSFFNPNCDTCDTNARIPVKKGQVVQELDPKTGKPLHPPTQVVRLNKTEDPYVDSINLYYQGLLAGSVWANYELISTQWFEFEAVFPSYLANSVQETYLQKPSPATYGSYKLFAGELYFKDSRYKPFQQDSSSSSCMGCHYIAKTQGKRSDFSFLLGEAK